MVAQLADERAARKVDWLAGTRVGWKVEKWVEMSVALTAEQLAEMLENSLVGS